MDDASIAYRFIEPGSPEHAGELDLRYRLLRAPLGRPRGSEVYAYEEMCLHVVAVDAGGDVVGCVVFHPEGDGDGPGTGRLLQMAVDERLQGRGVGRRLVSTLEERLAVDGVHTVTLHARDVAFGFYESLGYDYFGEPYDEVGVPHRNMRKRLG